MNMGKSVENQKKDQLVCQWPRKDVGWPNFLYCQVDKQQRPVLKAEIWNYEKETIKIYLVKNYEHKEFRANFYINNEN